MFQYGYLHHFLLEVARIEVVRVESLRVEARVGHHHHLTREKVDALAKCDLLVGVGVNDLEERLDSLRLEVSRAGLCLLIVKADDVHELSELRLIKDTVSIGVDALEL